MVATNIHIICKTLAVTLIKRIFVNNKIYNVSPYVLGFKYCDKCDEWFYTNDIICACCNSNLRSTTKSREGKDARAKTIKLLTEINYKPTIRPKYHLSNLDFEKAKIKINDIKQIQKLYNNRTYVYNPVNSHKYYLRAINKPEVKIMRFMKYIDRIHIRILYERRYNISRQRRYRAKDYNGFRAFMMRVEDDRT